MVYCIDHSLVTSASSGVLVNRVRLLESLAFVALRRMMSEIVYYKTKADRDVYFVTLLTTVPR